VQELQDNGVECSKMGEKFSDAEPSGRPSVVNDILFKELTKKFLKGGASQFQNICVNFHRLSQLG
jgi:hypothetical protein